MVLYFFPFVKSIRSFEVSSKLFIPFDTPLSYADCQDWTSAISSAVKTV